MRRTFRFAATLGLAAALVAGPALANDSGLEFANDPHGQDSEGIVFDTLIMRPLGIVSTIFGAALLVPISGIALITGHADQGREIVDATVGEPARWTFSDRLGEH